MISDLGYKIFLMFATVNIGAMGVFSLSVHFGRIQIRKLIGL